MEKQIISGPKIHFWAVGEAFFSDLSHFSEFENFSKYEDFGCNYSVTQKMSISVIELKSVVDVGFDFSACV